MLRAVVLASKLGLQAEDRDDAAEALAHLAGTSSSEAYEGLTLLQEEYNVLEWDEAFRQFDILGDAVPRTQFLSFVRQRVASTYDQAGKAALFASKASTWCDLLSDLECDFAEENKITTREWRYEAVSSSIDNLPMNLKLACDRWQSAVAVDEARGTIIYCYAEPDRDPVALSGDVKRMLRTAVRETAAPAIPILVVLLCDEDGVLGQTLAELAVLEESVGEEDRVKFGNLIPAHVEKLRQVLRSQIDSMIKRRRYVTPLKEDLEAQRLSRAGSELFSRVYRNPLAFPFDGFSTARGNAADSCLELTTELLLGKLDYDAVMGKPVKVKNRAVTVLKDSWGIFAKSGKVLTRPSHPVVRALTTKWDDSLTSGEQRLSVEQVLRQLCGPPHGANIASAALALGAFIAPRIDRLVIAREGQQYAISQWVQDGIFRGKFIDLNAARDVDLVMLGEESSEWEILLDEWEQAESYSARVACLERATELKERIPVPPALGYRELHLEELANTALTELTSMERKQREAFDKLEAGYERDKIGLIAWGASTLRDLSIRMAKEAPLWDDHQISELQPHVERARQTIIQRFPVWLSRQTPQCDTPDAVGEFKHKMLRLTGGNLKRLELDSEVDGLEKHVGQVIRNAETAAEARQLLRDVSSWLTSHGDAHRVVRVADGDALFAVGKEYAAKLQGMAQRIQMPDLAEARTQLSQFLSQLKNATEQIRKRAMRLWNITLRSIEDVEQSLEEVNTLVSAFENCTNDLADLHLMRRALRTYQEDYRQLDDDRLSWPEFEARATELEEQAKSVISEDDVPWPPGEVIETFATAIGKQRKQASTEWINGIEDGVAAIATMSAAEANIYHAKATSPPAVLTEPHGKRLEKVVRSIENRLDALKIDWLIEKFKELPSPSRRKFLQLVSNI